MLIVNRAYDFPLLRFFSLTLLLMTIGACANKPCLTGCLSVDTSTYNGGKQVYSSPNYVYRDGTGLGAANSDILVGLYWNSDFDTDKVVLIVYPLKDIPPEDSGTPINFKIDGETLRFDNARSDKVSNIRSTGKANNYFNKRVINNLNIFHYVLDIDDFIRIESASDIRVRLEMGNTNLEGYFGPAGIRNSFSSFKSKVSEFI